MEIQCIEDGRSGVAHLTIKTRSGLQLRVFENKDVQGYSERDTVRVDLLPAGDDENNPDAWVTVTSPEGSTETPVRTRAERDGRPIPWGI